MREQALQELQVLPDRLPQGGLVPQHGAGVVGDHHGDALAAGAPCPRSSPRLDVVPSRVCAAMRPRQQMTFGRISGDLALQVRQACGDLVRVGLAVLRRAALHAVGDEALRRVQPDGRQPRVQVLARRAHEGPARAVLLRPGAFADEQHRAVQRALPGHRRGAVGRKPALAAHAGRPPQLGCAASSSAAACGNVAAHAGGSLDAARRGRCARGCGRRRAAAARAPRSTVTSGCLRAKSPSAASPPGDSASSTELFRTCIRRHRPPFPGTARARGPCRPRSTAEPASMMRRSSRAPQPLLLQHEEGAR